MNYPPNVPTRYKMLSEKVLNLKKRSRIPERILFIKYNRLQNVYIMV